MTLDALQRATLAGGAADEERAQEEERVNGELRQRRIRQVLEWEAKGIDVNEASEK